MKQPFCMDCRTVLRGVEECPGGERHRVLDLARKEDLERLREEVWGPADWRRQKRALARAGGGGAALGGLGDVANGCTACDAADVGGGLGEILGAILVIIAVALIAVVIVWAIGKLIGWLRARANRPKPHGALLPPSRLLSRRRLVGTVVGPANGSAPFALEACAGWALELTCKRFVGNAVMMRDGESFGFEVRTDRGQVIRIAPGMLRLVRGGETDEPNETMLREHVASIDGGAGRSEEDLAPIPFERAQAIEVRPGDRIEVIATMDAADSGYRHADGSLLVVRGVPSVRKITGTRELPPPSQEPVDE
ncbi:MAG: hypothetical protein ACXWP4_00090 [Polyangiales bacterium]